MLAIEHVSNYIPTKRMDIEDQLTQLNFSKAEVKVFKKIYQLKEVPRSEEDSFFDFIINPLNTLLLHPKVKKEKIKYLVHAHTGRVVSPFGESLLHKIKYTLNLPNTQMFSVSLNNCASTLTALSIVEQLLEAETDPEARAIILIADLTFTPILQVIPNVSVMGDAATAVMINKTQKNHRFLGVVSNIYGRYAGGSWMKKNRAMEFEEQYIPMLLETIHMALSKVNLKLEDIQLILPHNVNAISWEKIRNGLGVVKEKIYLKNIENYGHCFGADIFINYWDALNENHLKPGDFYMMVTVGLGATVSAAIFEY